MKLLIIIGFMVLAILVVADASPAISSSNDNLININRNQLEDGFVRKLNQKCSQRDNNSCMMLKLIIYMNRIFKKSSIEVNENLSFTENKEIKINEDPDDEIVLARAQQSDSDMLGLVVGEKLWKFFQTRTLRYSLTNNTDFVMKTDPSGNFNVGVSINASQLAEGRAKRRIQGVIAAAFLAKAAVLGAIFLKGLILLTGKAFMVSVIALVPALLIAIKELVHKKQEVVHEVHPHHEHHESWGRAFDGFLTRVAQMPTKLFDGQDLAYNAQKIQAH